MSLKRPLAIFIMGVSGVGKSTIGNLLAKELSIPFFDGDDYHPKENIAKMKSGKPLNDDDRYPWLTALNELAKEQLQNNSCIIACSALKGGYRNILKKDIEAHTKWIFLNGSFDLIYQRLSERSQHFMPDSLLESQFDALEAPKEAIKVDIVLPPKKIISRIKTQLVEKSEFGVIGLGVMGTSLARNLASKGFHISVFNRHVDGKEEDIALKATKEHKELSRTKPFDELSAFVNSLQEPRKLLLMVNAGKPVDAVIQNLIPLLSKNDVIIDGGNSHFDNTLGRIGLLKEHAIHFIGTGISGGEEGALNGPSLMPSGDKNGYELVQPFLESIAAKDIKSKPCCTYIGPEGSGHFVKMVHNGIEYAEMQLLAEVYFILKQSGKNPGEIASIFKTWKSNANSFLLEITIDILKKKEGADWLIDKILDKSGNKGTGNWATVVSAKLGVPSTMISSALFARYLSSFKGERVAVNKKHANSVIGLSDVNLETLFSGYQFARLVNHAQGFKLLSEASKAYNWDLNLSEIARIWTNGCIIRSTLMQDLVETLKKSDNLLLEESFISKVKAQYPNTKTLTAQCITDEIPIPCISEAVNFFNGYKTAHSSANLIQAQRDYFGAHTYQRINDSSEKSYHTDWKKP